MHKLLEDINGWVQNGPMGNDKQQIPWGAIAGAGSSLLSGWMGARQNPNKPLGPGDIKRYMSPMQGVVNQMQGAYGRMQGIGQQMMDPNSGMNQQQQQMMQEQGANQLAMQHMLARRQAAAMGQDSGITAAQNRVSQGQTSRDLYQGHQQALMQNRMQGIGVLGQSQGLLGNIGSMQTGISENIAQSAIAQRQHQMDEWQRRNQIGVDVLGGMGSGFMNAYAAGANPGTTINVGNK
jgi:hypothetical protein